MQNRFIAKTPTAAMLLALTMLGGAPSNGAGACARDAMLVFDGSSSMADLGFGAEGPTRIEEARIAVAEVLPEVAPVRRIGLMTYGPGSTFLCQRVTLKLLPQDNAAGPVVEALNQMEPSGLTPLTLSVDKAAQVLDYEEKPGIVVLVTDGSETCGGAPCALGQKLAAEGRDLTVHVIGFRLVFDPFSWNGKDEAARVAGEVRCLAEATGGLYVATETVDELADALRRTLGCALIG
ncbi:MAG: VWA domain-containing protein [Pseudomonadota bacterium]